MKRRNWWKSFQERLNARSELFKLVTYFLKLGTIAFGGPAAHIALMHDGLVTRKRWLSDQQFFDLVSATDLIPGSNSTELAIHVGYLRAGWRGLIATGAAFILPAMLISMALAYLYVQYGMTPRAEALFYGVQPVVIVILAQALWLLRRKAVKNVVTAIEIQLHLLFAFEIGQSSQPQFPTLSAHPTPIQFDSVAWRNIESLGCVCPEREHQSEISSQKCGLRSRVPSSAREFQEHVLIQVGRVSIIRRGGREPS